MNSKTALRKLVTALAATATTTPAITEALQNAQNVLGPPPTPGETPAPIRHVVVRGDRSGAFAGEFVSQIGREVELKNARRLWYWSGAASLSELTQRGVSKPSECKFPAPVGRIKILDVIEVIDMTKEAVISLSKVSPWTA